MVLAARRGSVVGGAGLRRVSKALLNLDDLELLEDSGLAHYVPNTSAADPRLLFPNGQLVQTYCKEHLLPDLITRLPSDDRKLGKIRAVLEGVLQGKSIARIAREHHQSREHWARTHWKRAVEMCVISLRRASSK